MNLILLDVRHRHTNDSRYWHLSPCNRSEKTQWCHLIHVLESVSIIRNHEQKFLLNVDIQEKQEERNGFR